MSQLYWACSDTVLEEVLHLLAEHGRAAKVLGVGNQMPVIAVADPDPATLRLTAELLSQERITSAALTSKPLPEDELWVAAEWWRRIVVERSEVVRMEAISERLQPQGEHRGRGLVIFGLRSSPFTWSG